MMQLKYNAEKDRIEMDIGGSSIGTFLRKIRDYANPAYSLMKDTQFAAIVETSPALKALIKDAENYEWPSMSTPEEIIKYFEWKPKQVHAAVSEYWDEIIKKVGPKYKSRREEGKAGAIEELEKYFPKKTEEPKSKPKSKKSAGKHTLYWGKFGEFRKSSSSDEEAHQKTREYLKKHHAKDSMLKYNAETDKIESDTKYQIKREILDDLERLKQVSDAAKQRFPQNLDQYANNLVRLCKRIEVLAKQYKQAKE